jgi:hypothetical protein
MQIGSNPLPQFSSSKVIMRWALRSAAMATLAMFSSQGFAKSFAALIAICGMFCVVAVWGQIMSALAATHDAAVQMIDTSIVRVHQHAACIARNKRQSMGRSRGGLTS